MSNILIMQLNEEKAGRKLFLDYETTNKKFGGVNLTDYRIVWAGRRPYSSLEKAYEEFNISRPNDFYGHSLSVSDIISVDGVLWFCDSVGFVRL